MTMRLFDTAQGEIVDFDPPPSVRMYICGITPYDSTHLGHAFTYLTYDVVIRRLEDLGHDVMMVRNVTDVDDSILPKARELGIDYLELAASEMDRFHADMEALQTRPPIAEPRATESIDGIIAIVEQLERKGHTYTVEGTTYFDVTTFDDFGKLSGYNEATMVAFAAERGGSPDNPSQRNPLDFVLWQPSAEDEPVWDSPFGPGRPGWHIECSAMSMGIHGVTLDLHGGGDDLIFPHHECEIAQSESASGETFVRHWMHVGMVAYEGTKMSKSLGNLVFVSELSDSYDPRAIRVALLRHHYRAGFEWFDHEIEPADETLERLRDAAKATNGPDLSAQARALRAAIDNDLDTPTALGVLEEMAEAIAAGGDDPTAGHQFRTAAALLGIDFSD